MIASVVLLCFVAPSLALASETDGTIVTGGNAGYAWSNNAGWVNFGLTEGNIHVTDAGLTGDAWNGNTAWINLTPSNGGITNNGEGTLGGNAWGEGLGWIDFSGVTIDSAGQFQGSATGSLVGTLTFDCDNCDVRTDWRPVSARSTTPVFSGGGGGGGAATETILTPIELDLVKDGAFNILDFNAMMINWGIQEQGNPADMNRDGIVDIFDFNQIMVLWGTIYQL